MKSVGKVREAHGLKGDLYIHISSGDVSWISRLEKFYLKAKNQEDSEAQEYKVERTKPFKNGLIIKAQEIADRNASESLKAFDFLIDDDLLISRKGESIYLGEILNFKLKNTEQTVLGTIVGFGSNGAQDLLVIETLNNKKSEVPFVDQFIKKIDFKHQYVVMDLPEGLLDLDEV